MHHQLQIQPGIRKRSDRNAMTEQDRNDRYFNVSTRAASARLANNDPPPKSQMSFPGVTRSCSTTSQAPGWFSWCSRRPGGFSPIFRQARFTVNWAGVLSLSIPRAANIQWLNILPLACCTRRTYRCPSHDGYDAGFTETCIRKWLLPPGSVAETV
jgi:hypothetical protein